MDNNQNLFYTSISKYYSEIFPYNPAQLQFVKSRAGELTGKNILDIGCATGELAFQMAQSGAEVTGIDLNTDLLNQAKTSKKLPNLSFREKNMLHLKSGFQPTHFDMVLCFGNTLVHLESLEQVKQMAEGVFFITKPGGKFLVQILNYDYILDDQVSELPVIESENLKFIRRYAFEMNSPFIRFQTELMLKKENRSLFNETTLFALQHRDLSNILEQAGFSAIEFFSGFHQNPFGGKHLPLVVSCIRP
jgi:2-polyprenyl-3-methyl-5-hydroxy-6-metoxy-1,4-benzoquinol methylase